MSPRSKITMAGIGLFATGVVAGSVTHGVQVAMAHAVRATVLSITGLSFPRADTIVVADTIRGRCVPLAGEHKTACYEEQLMGLRAQRGTRFAMGALNRLSASDRDVMSGGHEYAHAIGITSFKESRDVAGAFKSCTEILQSGCYHGVIQTYLLSVPHVDTTAVRAVCHEYANADANQWLRFQCVHGMGHGLTMFYDHDVPRALQGCDLLAEEWDRKSCYGGVFMENIVFAEDPRMAQMVMDDAHHGAAPMKMDGAEHAAAPTKYAAIDSTDPFYPCSKLGERYQDDCWSMQPAVILHLRNNDFARTFQVCDSAPVKYRHECYAGSGTEVSGQTLRDPNASIRLCARGNPKYQPFCYEGVVKNYIDVTANYRDGFAFCRVVPGRANKLKCYESVGEEIAVLRNGLDARAPLCNEVALDAEGREACLYGAQVNQTAPVGFPIVP